VAARYRPRRHRHAERGREAASAAEGIAFSYLGRESSSSCTWEYVRKTGNTIIESAQVIGLFLLLEADTLHSRRRVQRPPCAQSSSVWKKADLRGHHVIHLVPALPPLGPPPPPLGPTEEAEHHETTVTLYHIQYPLVDWSASSRATTRPERCASDTSVAVNPKTRRRPYIGKKVLVRSRTSISRSSPMTAWTGVSGPGS